MKISVLAYVVVSSLVLVACTSGPEAGPPSPGSPSPSLTPSSLPSPSPTPEPPLVEGRLDGTFVAESFVTQLTFDPRCKNGACDVDVHAIVFLSKKDKQKTDGRLTLKGRTYKGTLDVETTCDFHGGPTFHPKGHLELVVTVLKAAFAGDVWSVSKVRSKAQIKVDRFVSTSSSGSTITTYTCDPYSFGDSFTAQPR